MSKNSVAISALVFFAALLAGCGGSDDGGIFKNAGQQQPQSQTNPSNAAPDVAKQQQSRPAQLPGQPQQQQNQPANVPPNQVPQVQTGSTTGACGLLTKQDATAALGGPVSDAKSFDMPKQNMGVMTVDLSTCSYDRTSGPAASAEVQTWRNSDANQVKTMAGFICQAKEKVNGLGDVACWYDKEHRELQAFKGGVFIDLTVHGVANDAVVTNLAKTVLDRVK